MKSHVSMGYTVCFVCGSVSEDSVLIHKHLEQELEPRTCTGYGFCEEHQKLVDDGYIFLLEAVNDTGKDSVKSHEVTRTGNFAAIRRTVLPKVFEHFQENVEDLPHSIFVEVGVLDALDKLQKQSEDQPEGESDE